MIERSADEVFTDAQSETVIARWGSLPGGDDISDINVEKDVYIRPGAGSAIVTETGFAAGDDRLTKGKITRERRERGDEQVL